MEKTNVQGYIEKQMKNAITDFNNPNCINCTECCDLTVIISEKEYEFYKKYFKTTGKKIFLEAKKTMNDKLILYKKTRTIDLTCPFMSKNKRCKIYQIRPQICKDFHCTPSLCKKDFNKYDYRSGFTISSLFEKR